MEVKVVQCRVCHNSIPVNQIYYPDESELMDIISPIFEHMETEHKGMGSANLTSIISYTNKEAL